MPSSFKYLGSAPLNVLFVVTRKPRQRKNLRKSSRLLHSTVVKHRSLVVNCISSSLCATRCSYIWKNAPSGHLRLHRNPVGWPDQSFCSLRTPIPISILHVIHDPLENREVFICLVRMPQTIGLFLRLFIIVMYCANFLMHFRLKVPFLGCSTSYAG